ncbi:MAG: hypothetical protein BWY52_01767 [Chloroflexi bacterium ADurb.Bin325]|nr:MAG: hypothetical protein BWY52_01767 [Chloroflexi bacterium ADurb.Bin325]
MQAIQARFNYLFRSTKGLILVAIALISLVTALWGMLSGPLKEWGISAVAAQIYGMKFVEAEREGRIILLYHTIAMAVIAILTYMITGLVRMKPQQQANINATITVGYITSLVFGLWFGYFGHNFVFHGLFIVGQALVFFAGLQLAVALWPWRPEYHVTDPAYAHTRGGVDLERVAFFAMTVVTLISAVFGAVAGSLFGNGFQTVMSENIVRQPLKTPLELAVIGHLHIMLELIAVALTLVVGRWFDFKGKLHRWAMPLMIIGTLIVAGGVWAVVPFEPIAHVIINVGAFPTLIASWLLVWFGWRKIAAARLAERGVQRASFGQKLSALLHDPLKFGMLWQMIYMNFVVTAVGIFMAIRLDAAIRVWSLRDEQVGLTGHWHILSGIIATIILLMYADMTNLKGKTRQWFGWTVIIASDIAFAAVTLFETKRLYVTEAAQQPLVDTVMIVSDIGLVAVLIALAALMVWRLIDLFKRQGRWAAEATESRLEDAAAEVGR